MVDEAVTAMLADITLDHDAPAIGLKDIVRVVHRHLSIRWLDEAADARTTSCGQNTVPHGGAARRGIGTWSVVNAVGGASTCSRAVNLIGRSQRQ